jgi:predicted nucleic acid-binding protein
MSGARRTISTTRAEVELQERDLAILQGLFESRLMTLNHVTHLYFNGHSEAAKKRIQRLKEDRYVRETGMNLAALRYDLQLCREHGTYVDTETLAFAIHHVLQGDTEELIKHLSAHVVEYAAERYYELIISPVIIREFAGASRRDFQVNEDKHLRFIKFLGKTGSVVVPRTIPDVIREDPPDNHILACALVGNANLIVSHDLDLLRLRTFKTIGIVSPIDFLNTLGSKKAA